MKQNLEFTLEELIELHKKLIYKTNPVWVMLRDRIRKQSDYCLSCGHKRHKRKD